VGSRSKARARAQASQAAGQPSAAPPRQAGSCGRQAGAGSQRPQTRSISQRPGAAGQATPPRPQADRTGRAGQAPGQPPRTVLALALIEAVEACIVLLAAILAGLDTGSGKSYHLASGIAITVIGAATALLLGLVARGLRAGRRWSRTPTLLTQLFIAIVGIYLTQGGRWQWGIPALVLAVGGFAMLMAPASVELLTPGRVGKTGQS
jgi:hypothetical protein